MMEESQSNKFSHLQTLIHVGKKGPLSTHYKHFYTHNYKHFLDVEKALGLLMWALGFQVSGDCLCQYIHFTEGKLMQLVNE
jgi:hypothetical protein